MHPKPVPYPLRQKRIREETELAGRPQLDPGLKDRFEAMPKLPVRLIVCPLGKAANQGGIIRLAECFRLERVEVDLGGEEMADFSGSAGSLNWVDVCWRGALESIEDARQAGNKVYGLSLSEGARDVSFIPFEFPCALVLGSEGDGIPAEVLAQCDETVAIPLYGLCTSLNVSQAAAICVYEMVRQSASHEPARESSRRLKGLTSLEPGGSKTS